MNPEAEDLEYIFKGLERLMIKEISTLWDIAALEHYNKEGLIPQGLRWQLPLNTGEEDAHDLLAWEGFLNHCASNAMSFIIDMRKKKLTHINEQIEEYKAKLEPFKNLDDYREFSTLCQKNIKKIEISIKEKKFKKYLKTKSDYDNHTIYKWHKNQVKDLLDYQEEPTNRPIGQLPVRETKPIREFNQQNHFNHTPKTPKQINHQQKQERPFYNHPSNVYSLKRKFHNKRWNNQKGYNPQRNYNPQRDYNPHFVHSHQSYNPHFSNHYQGYNMQRWNDHNDYNGHNPNGNESHLRYQTNQYNPQRHFNPRMNYHKNNRQNPNEGNQRWNKWTKQNEIQAGQNEVMEQQIDLPFDINRENFPHQQIGDHHSRQEMSENHLSVSTPGKRKIDVINEKHGSDHQPKKAKDS